MKMKKIFRRNQIIITTLAIMIAAAGYLNYSGKKEVSGSQIYEAGMTDISDEDILAENQAALDADGQYEEIASLDQDPDQLEDAEVTGSDQAEAGGSQAETGNGQAEAGSNQAEAGNSQAEAGSQLAENDASETGIENPGEAVLTGGTSVADYIANVQLSREQVRAKNKETLMEVINSQNIDEASKQQAIQDMIDMTAVSEKENAAETLLMAKGFADPVVSITDGKVDVVINASSITDPQRAQIEDIVKRKTEVSADNIIITLLKLQE